MSTSELQDYTFVAKYARWIPEKKRRETCIEKEKRERREEREEERKRNERKIKEETRREGGEGESY